MIGENHVNLDQYEIISARDAHLYGGDVTEEERKIAEQEHLAMRRESWNWFFSGRVPFLFLIALTGFWLYFCIIAGTKAMPAAIVTALLFLFELTDGIRQIVKIRQLHKLREDYHVFSGRFLEDSVKFSNFALGLSNIHWYDHYLTAEVAKGKAVTQIACRKDIADTLRRGDRLVMMYYKDGSVFVIKKGNTDG